MTPRERARAAVDKYDAYDAVPNLEGIITEAIEAAIAEEREAISVELKEREAVARRMGFNVAADELMSAESFIRSRAGSGRVDG